MLWKKPGPGQAPILGTTASCSARCSCVNDVSDLWLTLLANGSYASLGVPPGSQALLHIVLHRSIFFAGYAYVSVLGTQQFKKKFVEFPNADAMDTEGPLYMQIRRSLNLCRVSASQNL